MATGRETWEMATNAGYSWIIRELRARPDQVSAKSKATDLSFGVTHWMMSVGCVWFRTYTLTTKLWIDKV